MNLNEFQIKHAGNAEGIDGLEPEVILAIKRMPARWRQDLLFKNEMPLIRTKDIWPLSDKGVISTAKTICFYTDMNSDTFWRHSDDPKNYMIVKEEGRCVKLRKLLNKISFEVSSAAGLFREVFRSAFTASTQGYTIEYLSVHDTTIRYQYDLNWRARSVMTILPLVIVLFILSLPFVGTFQLLKEQYLSAQSRSKRGVK